MVWYDLVWIDMVWYGLVWLVWFGMVWYLVWYGGGYAWECSRMFQNVLRDSKKFHGGGMDQYGLV